MKYYGLVFATRVRTRVRVGTTIIFTTPIREIYMYVLYGRDGTLY